MSLSRLSECFEALQCGIPKRSIPLIEKAQCLVKSSADGLIFEYWVSQVEKLFDVACTLIDVMSCVPPSASSPPTPQDSLNQLLALISSLRGGESRYLPLVMAKIRDTLPSIASGIPPGLVRKAAIRPNTGGPIGPVSSIIPPVGHPAAPPPNIAGVGGVGSNVANHITVSAAPGVHIKMEGSVGSSSSGQSSPFDTPPFMHYYPLA